MKKKLIDPKITILINSEYTEIFVEDSGSSTTFINIRLTPEQLSKCLSRLGHTSCEVEVSGLDRIGKIHENKKFDFEIPEEARSRGSADILEAICKKALEKEKMGEWQSDGYYKSQDSFFSQGGKTFARTIIRRWI